MRHESPTSDREIIEGKPQIGGSERGPPYPDGPLPKLRSPDPPIGRGWRGVCAVAWWRGERESERARKRKQACVLRVLRVCRECAKSRRIIGVASTNQRQGALSTGVHMRVDNGGRQVARVGRSPRGVGRWRESRGDRVAETLPARAGRNEARAAGRNNSPFPAFLFPRAPCCARFSDGGGLG